MSQLKIENTDYTKDDNTGIIVNNNKSEYLNARARRSKQKRDQEKINNLQSELTDVKSTMAELVKLVQDLNNGNNYNK